MPNSLCTATACIHCSLVPLAALPCVCRRYQLGLLVGQNCASKQMAGATLATQLSDELSAREDSRVRQAATAGWGAASDDDFEMGAPQPPRAPMDVTSDADEMGASQPPLAPVDVMSDDDFEMGASQPPWRAAAWEGAEAPAGEDEVGMLRHDGATMVRDGGDEGAEGQQGRGAEEEQEKQRLDAEEEKQLQLAISASLESGGGSAPALSSRLCMITAPLHTHHCTCTTAHAPLHTRYCNLFALPFAARGALTPPLISLATLCPRFQPPPRPPRLFR